MQILAFEPASYPLCQGGWKRSLLRVAVELLFLGLWRRLSVLHTMAHFSRSTVALSWKDGKA